MKNWYQIKNKAEGVLDISIHDEIGMWGVSASDFIGELRGQDPAKVINLSVHSPGGSVLDGLAMYNALSLYPAKIYGHVEGIAASAASFVLMAADTISMPEDAFIMIHNANGGVMGDADDMREMADIVDKLQASIVNIYQKRTGLDSDVIETMMKAETWMNASDALDQGFIDTIVDAIDVAAKIGEFDKYFKSLPVEDSQADECWKIETVKDFEKYLRDVGGFSKRLAEALTSRGKVVLRVDPVGPEAALAQVSEALNKVKVPVSTQ